MATEVPENPVEWWDVHGDQSLGIPLRFYTEKEAVERALSRQDAQNKNGKLTVVHSEIIWEWTK